MVQPGVAHLDGVSSTPTLVAAQGSTAVLSPACVGRTGEVLLPLLLMMMAFPASPSLAAGRPARRRDDVRARCGQEGSASR